VRRAVLVGAALLLGCAAKPPPEPPTRILSLERAVAIVVETRPSGLEVWDDGADGRPGRLLGVSPVVLEEMSVDKEIWKYGAEPPPPVVADARHELSGDGSSISVGEPLRWTVHVASEGGRAPVRIELAVSPRQLARAFSAGRLVFSVDSRTGQVAGP